MSSSPDFTPILEQPLIPEPPPRPSYEQRIGRAKDLAAFYPAAADLLQFYARVTLQQQTLFERFGECAPGDESWSLDLERVLPFVPDFVRGLAEISPAPVRNRTFELAAGDDAARIQLLTDFWNSGFSKDSSSGRDLDRFIALAFLQPYAERLAQAGGKRSITPGQATCPICGSEPICAVLRDRGHGAGRSLICSLCMNEWNFLRVICPACGEERFESLPVFTSGGTPHIRIDACDTCHHYLNTIDMTKDGLAVPVVDELAAVSLDLWAIENSYQKLTANIAGM